MPEAWASVPWCWECAVCAVDEVGWPPGLHSGLLMSAALRWALPPGFEKQVTQTEIICLLPRLRVGVEAALLCTERNKELLSGVIIHKILPTEVLVVFVRRKL